MKKIIASVLVLCTVVSTTVFADAITVVNGHTNGCTRYETGYQHNYGEHLYSKAGLSSFNGSNCLADGEVAINASVGLEQAVGRATVFSDVGLTNLNVKGVDEPTVDYSYSAGVRYNFASGFDGVVGMTNQRVGQFREQFPFAGVAFTF